MMFQFLSLITGYHDDPADTCLLQSGHQTLRNRDGTHSHHRLEISHPAAGTCRDNHSTRLHTITYP